MKIAFVLRDGKTGSYNAPVFVDSVATMVRSLLMAVRSEPGSILAQFPQDYDVWRIGQFHEDSGRMEILQDMEWQFNVAQLLNEQMPKAERKVENG